MQIIYLFLYSFIWAYFRSFSRSAVLSCFRNSFLLNAHLITLKKYIYLRLFPKHYFRVSLLIERSVVYYLAKAVPTLIWFYLNELSPKESPCFIYKLGFPAIWISTFPEATIYKQLASSFSLKIVYPIANLTIIVLNANVFFSLWDK